MPIIKIAEPIKECMDCEAYVNEEQCRTDLEVIKRLCECKNDIEQNKAINEIAADTAFTIAFAGLAGIAAIFGAINSFIKKSYKMKYHKIITASKELNDLYAKVEYLISHDKMARFKHRNDLVNFNGRVAVATDSRNMIKKYQAVFDFGGIDIEDANNLIEYIWNSGAEQNDPKRRREAILNASEDAIKSVDKFIEEEGWYAKYCKINLITDVVKNVKLEKALRLYKNNFEVVYTIIDEFNDHIADYMTYIKALEHCYNTNLNRYKSDPDMKKAIDEIFRKILEDYTNRLKINNDIIDIYNQKIEYYAKDLEELYNIIKS